MVLTDSILKGLNSIAALQKNRLVTFNRKNNTIKFEEND